MKLLVILMYTFVPLLLSLSFLSNLIMAVLKAIGVAVPLPWGVLYWMLVVVIFITYGVGAGDNE